MVDSASGERHERSGTEEAPDRQETGDATTGAANGHSASAPAAPLLSPQALARLRAGEATIDVWSFVATDFESRVASLAVQLGVTPDKAVDLLAAAAVREAGRRSDRLGMLKRYWLESTLIVGLVALGVLVARGWTQPEGRAVNSQVDDWLVIFGFVFIGAAFVSLLVAIVAAVVAVIKRAKAPANDERTITMVSDVAVLIKALTAAPQWLALALIGAGFIVLGSLIQGYHFTDGGFVNTAPGAQHAESQTQNRATAPVTTAVVSTVTPTP